MWTSRARTIPRLKWTAWFVLNCKSVNYIVSIRFFRSFFAFVNFRTFLNSAIFQLLHLERAQNWSDLEERFGYNSLFRIYIPNCKNVFWNIYSLKSYSYFDEVLQISVYRFIYLTLTRHKFTVYSCATTGFTLFSRYCPSSGIRATQRTFTKKSRSTDYTLLTRRMGRTPCRASPLAFGLIVSDIIEILLFGMRA